MATRYTPLADMWILTRTHQDCVVEESADVCCRIEMRKSIHVFRWPLGDENNEIGRCSRLYHVEDDASHMIPGLKVQPFFSGLTNG